MPIRLGTPALTSRGMKEADFEKVGDFMDQAIELGIAISKAAGGTCFHFGCNVFLLPCFKIDLEEIWLITRRMSCGRLALMCGRMLVRYGGRGWWRYWVCCAMSPATGA